MSIKLWTSPLSYNSLRPELVLAEKGIEDVEVVPADIITGKHKTPEFWEKSIFGRVPLMEDGDFVLFESRAIARYFALKYLNTGPKLMPVVNDPKTNGIFGMWMIVEVEEFNLHAVPVITETIVAPAVGRPVDEAVLERHKARLAKCLDVLDKTLSKMPYLGGDEYSLVDINYMPTMYVIAKCVDVFGGRANLQKWWANVSSRNAWKKVIKPLDDAYGSVVPDWQK